MRLTVLGSSGTYPTADNPASGYLVTAGSTRLWIDAGPGTFRALLRRTKPEELDGVVISHIHPDHCSDLFALYHYLAYGPRVTLVPVYAPSGIAEAFGEFVGAGTDHVLWQVLEFTTTKGGDEVPIGDVNVRFATTDHPVPTLAVRLEADSAALTYSSDTGPAGNAFQLAEGSDVFLCEATFQGEAADKPSPHHLTSVEAATLAAQAGCRSLALTHIHPELDPALSVAAAKAVFDGPVSAPRAGDEVDF